ncbi:HAMP domain-containing histidine kinase [Paenibacillus barcinonensis]|uniref:histidine kinase n=1 Tax=Paenibacillus barcinonensis TaxID=198119 RepID=A0A2V4WKP5_PAEBA|nr:HAMP domain-containing sensor histidine kinase [Paenibacillus barcinonensis]PYE48054.1 signal transduction histidine kinase [Paenibacillus barcinonensis]QKS55167.1 HAMP domain-containing histidine kinase [Paenibacillus barcinonensis]
MVEVMRNPEWKSVFTKFILVQLGLAICIYFVMNMQIQSINQTIVNQHAAFVGQVLSQQPQLEQQLVHSITQDTNPQHVVLGKRILSQYGYTEQMSIHDQSAFSGTSLPVSTALIFMLCGIPVLLLLLWEYRNIFVKIRKVTVAAEQVVEGRFDTSLSEHTEGDLSALGHSFNMMAGRLHHSVEQLKQEKTFLSHLLTDISHQLKTPLASLLVFNENMLHDPLMKVEMRTTFLERSRLQIERMEWLIISLLKLARVEAGAIVFHLQNVRPKAIVESTVLSLQTLAEQKKQTILVQGGEGMVLYADEEWLTEAIINLIKNALEHSPVSGKVYITLEDEGLFHSILIRDEGEGISPEQIPNVFTRFYRGRSNAKPHSTGVGLSLTKSIIEGLGGTISVSSEQGKGSEFRITFMKTV